MDSTRHLQPLAMVVQAKDFFIDLFKGLNKARF